MIDFLNLKKINALYSAKLKQLASEVIDSGWYILGDHVKTFEDSLKKYIGVKQAIGVSNGLDALRLILRAYIEMGKLNEGDEVIVPANTYIATILAITENRLKPTLVEPDLNTYNMDISLIEKHITSKTRAIMVVHLYGRACWSKELEYIAQKHNLLIVEDNAQAIGAEWNGVKTGALGHAAGFSFYPGKNLGALGDAGAITTNNSELAEIVKMLANYGGKQKYINDYQGFNCRLDEIQAAFLNYKLSFLDEDNQNRREVAQYYCNRIKNPDIILPSVATNLTTDLSHVWHLFVIRHANRDELQRHMTNKGIQTLIHYPIPPSKQKAYYEYNHMHFPKTEQIANETLSLPIGSHLLKKEIDTIIKTLNTY